MIDIVSVLCKLRIEKCQKYGLFSARMILTQSQYNTLHSSFHAFLIHSALYSMSLYSFFCVHLKYSKPDSSALCHRSRMTQCLISYLPTRFCLFCPDGPFARPARIVVCKARDDIQQSIIYRTNFELSSPSWIDIDTGRTRLGFGTSGPVLGTTVNHEMIQIKGSTVN